MKTSFDGDALNVWVIREMEFAYQLQYVIHPGQMVMDTSSPGVGTTVSLGKQPTANLNQFLKRRTT